MKKIYLEPEIEIVELHMSSPFLSGSIGDAEGGDGDGGVTPTDGGDPTDPDWGSDYSRLGLWL